MSNCDNGVPVTAKLASETCGHQVLPEVMAGHTDGERSTVVPVAGAR
jgi:hypothetical protein